MSKVHVLGETFIWFSWGYIRVKHRNNWNLLLLANLVCNWCQRWVRLKIDFIFSWLYYPVRHFPKKFFRCIRSRLYVKKHVEWSKIQKIMTEFLRIFMGFHSSQHILSRTIGLSWIGNIVPNSVINRNSILTSKYYSFSLEGEDLPQRYLHPHFWPHAFLRQAKIWNDRKITSFWEKLILNNLFRAKRVDASLTLNICSNTIHIKCCIYNFNWRQYLYRTCIRAQRSDLLFN